MKTRKDPARPIGPTSSDAIRFLLYAVNYKIFCAPFLFGFVNTTARLQGWTLSADITLTASTLAQRYPIAVESEKV